MEVRLYDSLIYGFQGRDEWPGCIKLPLHQTILNMRYSLLHLSPAIKYLSDFHIGPLRNFPLLRMA